MSFLSDCLTKDTSKPIKMKLLRGMHYWLTLTGWPKVYMARLRSSLVRQDVRVTLTVLFYMFSSISLVMLNKLVLNVTETPILFLWMQLVVAVALLHLAAYFGVFQLPTIEWQKCKNVMPLILINAIGLSANTYCLQEVDASLFQVARSLTLPFTVVLSTIFLGKSNSILVVIASAIIFMGFLVGTALDTLHYESLGFLYGLFSALTTASHAIIIKKSLHLVGDNTLDLVYYNNLLSAALLLPWVLFSGELALASDMLQIEEGTSLSQSPLGVFLAGSLLTGFFGFLINLAGFLQIKITSPVTHMVSSAFRGVIQTFVAMAVFGELVSSKRWVGIALTVGGSCLYTWVRHKESLVTPTQQFEKCPADEENPKTEGTASMQYLDREASRSEK